MRALNIIFLLLAGITVVQAGESNLNSLFKSTLPTIEVAGNCTLDREATSGSQKFCYYNCIDGEKEVTISATEYCPLDMD
jgi:hypothetical protein